MDEEHDYNYSLYTLMKLLNNDETYLKFLFEEITQTIRSINDLKVRIKKAEQTH